MNKNLMLLLVSLLLAISIVYLTLNKSQSNDESFVAIFTTLSHPALESVRQGFIEELKIRNPEIAILDYNAQGNMQQANTIANQIASKSNIQGILAIGTLAALSMAQAEKSKPIVVAAVSDTKAIRPENKNVCGLSDAIDASFQIKTIKELLPKVKRLSLLFSPSEPNSVSMVKNLQEAGQKALLEIIEIGVHEPQQILSAALDACQKSDAILIPLDNMVVASMPLVIKATKNLPCPIITSNESPIYDGATLAFALDYQKSGQRAAGILNEILANKTTPDLVGFIKPETLDLYLNQQVATKKGLEIKDAQVVLHRIKGEE